MLIILAVLLICFATATPADIAHARAHPPPWIRIASWAALGVLALVFGQLLI